MPRPTGLVKCHGKDCPNGGRTHIMSDDTVWVGDKAYCSACTPAERRDPPCGGDVSCKTHQGGRYDVLGAKECRR